MNTMFKYWLLMIMTYDSFIPGAFGDFDPNAVPHTTKAELMTMVEAGEEVLVYFYTKFEDCPKCKEKMPEFQEAVGYLDKLEDGKVKSFKIAVKFPEYGVNIFPQLLLFMGNIPFRYDKSEDFSPDNIVDWIEEAKQTPLPQLSDETFEHLTQASTGATTGDWLIMFANGKRPECMKPNLPDISTAAIRLRRRKNVAVVDTSTNPVTTRRFGFDMDTICIKIIFFHRTDMYHYTSDDRSTSALLDFVLKGYTNEEALKVPPPRDNKNEQMENMIKTLTDTFQQHADLSQLAFISGVGFGFLAVFGVLIFILRRFRKRKIL